MKLAGSFASGSEKAVITYTFIGEETVPISA